MTQFELDTRAAEIVLYEWACGLHTDETVEKAMAFFGVDIDLNQRDHGNLMRAKYHGRKITLEI